MSQLHTAVKKLAQLTWSPKVGDSIYFTKTTFLSKPKRGKITHVLETGEVRIDNSIKTYMTTEVSYRPVPADYDKILNLLSSGFAYISETSTSGHKVAALPVNGRNVILRGRARKILISLLDLRNVDYRINALVNGVVARLRFPREEVAVVVPFSKDRTP